MTLFDSVGPSHWGAWSYKIKVDYVQHCTKPTETGHEAPGTTVTAYLISFPTITGVFSMEVIITSCYRTECFIQSFCGQN